MNITNLKSRIQKLSDHGLASLAKVKVAQIENNRGDYEKYITELFLDSEIDEIELIIIENGE